MSALKQFEVAEAVRAHRSKVPLVQSGDLRRAEPLSRHHHGGVRQAQREISVLSDKLRDARPVLVDNRLDPEGPSADILDERQFSLSGELRAHGALDPRLMKYETSARTSCGMTSSPSKVSILGHLNGHDLTIPEARTDTSAETVTRRGSGAGTRSA